MRRIRRENIVQYVERDVLTCDFCGTKEDVQQLLEVSIQDGEEGMYHFHADACYECTYENDDNITLIYDLIEALHVALKGMTRTLDVIAPNFGYPYPDPDDEYEDEEERCSTDASAQD